MTVSTVGLVPAIERLTAEKLQVRLAVSLHTPDDELRDTLVPVNDRWKIDEVLEAARAYADTTGRRVSIEYALIRDINDQPWRADLLGKLLREHLGPAGARQPDPAQPDPRVAVGRLTASPVQDEFVRRVRAQGVACTVRDTRGQEIAAACGQLAAEGVRPPTDEPDSQHAGALSACPTSTWRTIARWPAACDRRRRDVDRDARRQIRLRQPSPFAADVGGDEERRRQDVEHDRDHRDHGRHRVVAQLLGVADAADPVSTVGEPGLAGPERTHLHQRSVGKGQTQHPWSPGTTYRGKRQRLPVAVLLAA